MIEPVYRDELATVYLGDAEAVLAALPAASVDAVVTDPPYGLGEEPDIVEVLRCWLAGERYLQGSGGFMGKRWDAFVPDPSIWRQAIRVLRPGGHLLCFAGTRTADLTGIALRLAGFEIRDEVLGLGCRLNWLYGSGFPKSLDVSKAIDRMAGAEREVVGSKLGQPGYSLRRQGPGGVLSGRADGSLDNAEGEYAITAAATDAARRWQGWGTALKPAHEPIILARRPLAARSVAANVLRHSTGALNVDGCRLGAGAGDLRDGEPSAGRTYAAGGGTDFAALPGPRGGAAAGRWPANVVLCHAEGCRPAGERRIPTGTAVRHRGVVGGAVYSNGLWRQGRGTPDMTYADGDGLETVEAWDCVEGCPVAELDHQSGTERNGSGIASPRSGGIGGGMSGDGAADHVGGGYGDRGGASRFYYVAKASRADRNVGLVHGRNRHPTVKPVPLMRWLVRLVTPPGGLVLDCYAGTGSTLVAAKLEGVRCIGIDDDSEPGSVDTCVRRLGWAMHQLTLLDGGRTGPAGHDQADKDEAAEVELEL